MTYIDGFVIPVPAGKKDAYREMAAKAAPVFQEFGALEVVETWGDDVPHGKITDFYRAVGAEEGVQMGGMMDKPENIPVSAWGFYINAPTASTRPPSGSRPMAARC